MSNATRLWCTHCSAWKEVEEELVKKVYKTPYNLYLECNHIRIVFDDVVMENLRKGYIRDNDGITLPIRLV